MITMTATIAIVLFELAGYNTAALENKSINNNKGRAAGYHSVTSWANVSRCVTL